MSAEQYRKLVNLLEDIEHKDSDITRFADAYRNSMDSEQELDEKFDWRKAAAGAAAAGALGAGAADANAQLNLGDLARAAGTVHNIAQQAKQQAPQAPQAAPDLAGKSYVVILSTHDNADEARQVAGRTSGNNIKVYLNNQGKYAVIDVLGKNTDLVNQYKANGQKVSIAPIDGLNQGIARATGGNSGSSASANGTNQRAQSNQTDQDAAMKQALNKLTVNSIMGGPNVSDAEAIGRCSAILQTSGMYPKEQAIVDGLRNNIYHRGGRSNNEAANGYSAARRDAKFAIVFKPEVVSTAASQCAQVARSIR